MEGKIGEEEGAIERWMDGRSALAPALSILIYYEKDIRHEGSC